MSSDAKIESNRRNAARSTGPRTPEGKLKSSRNGVRHGLLCRAVVLEEEDADAFLALKDALIADLAPVGVSERLLVDRIVICHWRLGRVARAEGEILSAAVAPLRIRALSRGSSLTTGFGVFMNPIGITLAAVDPAIGDRLLRYETSFERSLYRAMHELERMQARRLGQEVTPPSVVDVDVHLDMETAAPEAAAFCDPEPVLREPKADPEIPSWMNLGPDPSSG